MQVHYNLNPAYFSNLIICPSLPFPGKGKAMLSFLFVVLITPSLPSTWNAFLHGIQLSVLSSPAVLPAAVGRSISGDLLPPSIDS